MTHRLATLALIATLGTLAAATLAGPANAAPRLGRPTPPLAGPTLSGAPLDLADLHGRVVVLNLWASWCGPCREEMPALDAFYRRYAARGVLVAGLSTDDAQAWPMVRRAADAVSYPNLMAASAPVNGYGMPPRVPVTVVIGPDGIVRAITGGENGLLTEQRLAALVEPLLTPRTPRP